MKLVISFAVHIAFTCPLPPYALTHNTNRHCRAFDVLFGCVVHNIFQRKTRHELTWYTSARVWLLMTVYRWLMKKVIALDVFVIRCLYLLICFSGLQHKCFFYIIVYDSWDPLPVVVFPFVVFPFIMSLCSTVICRVVCRAKSLHWFALSTMNVFLLGTEQLVDICLILVRCLSLFTVHSLLVWIFSFHNVLIARLSFYNLRPHLRPRLYPNHFRRFCWDNFSRATKQGRRLGRWLK